MRRFFTLLRSLLASGAATITDLGTLTFAVSVLGISPRVASVPALVLAGVVNFIANRRFAFRVRGGNVAHHALPFAGVQLVTIALNALAFDLAMHVDALRPYYWAVRLVIANVIYLLWSFPMFERIFTVRDTLKA